MFDLANDRLGYGELLRPEIGYTLDLAVGMTYSLDLQALLGVPVSLGLLDNADEADLQNQICMLEAIRQSADRIILFCDAGAIRLPGKILSVYSLLENSVFPVQVQRSGHFHPKLWVLKYSQQGMPSYIKLLVMSRNLTFDGSIDVAAAMRGEVGEDESDKNRPLSDFLCYVAGFADKRRPQVLALAQDVRRVSSFEVSAPFEAYDFFPIGIPGYSGQDCVLLDAKSDLFAVSPFLSDGIVRKMAQCRGHNCLVTRKRSVTQAVMEAFEKVYVTRDVLSDNEFGARQDIHAKLYYTSAPEGNYLYLGSANASHNAFSRNIECLLRLRYKSYGMGFRRFFKDFIPDDDCPYELLTAVPCAEAEDPRRAEIEQALREAVSALKSARVVRENERYSILLEAKALRTQEVVQISPLQREDLQYPLAEHNRFDGMLLKELSAFYILQVDGQKLVVKVPTRGIPEKRDQEIYRSIIDTKDKFMRYLAFALYGDLSAGAVETPDLRVPDASTASATDAVQVQAALYEQLLRVFHQDPAKIRGISDMIRRLRSVSEGDSHDSVVDKDFIEMFSRFEKAVKKVRK